MLLQKQFNKFINISPDNHQIGGQISLIFSPINLVFYFHFSSAHTAGITTQRHSLLALAVVGLPMAPPTCSCLVALSRDSRLFKAMVSPNISSTSKHTLHLEYYVAKQKQFNCCILKHPLKLVRSRFIHKTRWITKLGTIRRKHN